MNAKYHIPHSAFRKVLGIAEELPALKSKKDPVIAAVAGFALGGIGLGLYLQSWLDFLMPGLILISLVIVSTFTAGLPLLFVPVVWAIYGYRRVKASNAKLAHRGGGEILEAEIIVTQPPPIQIPTRTAATLETRFAQIDDLFQKGFLTPAEREEKRRQILGEL
jgi:hypothetical protein